eukprot:maker-scaffold83_size396513-snap-gene-2.32 protein:Tk00969 transcript:maker-scaffold83_size396513-snap-gene-2.32-mRNA-1 annotation:"PREDICTED: uncharacterized protein LOC103466540"
MTVASSIEYDNVLKYIGQCGKWQWRNFFLLWLTSAAGGLAVVVWVFTGKAMDHRCMIPHCETPSSASYFEDGTDHLPIFAEKLEPLGHCNYYDIAGETSISCNEYLNQIDRNDTSLVLKNCTWSGEGSRVFDTTVVDTSVIMDFGMICGDNGRPFLGATYMLGMLVGSFVLGHISDLVGRMKALMISVVLISVSGIIGAFMPDPFTFGFFRFVTGMGGIGCFMVTFVLCVEYVGAKYTMLIGIAIEIPFALGEAILGVESIFIRDWFTLQLVAHAPLILLLGLWFLVPESPRWLLATGEHDAAVKIIREAARVNGREIPESVLAPSSHPSEKPETLPPTPNLKDLFQPGVIAKRTLNMFYQWFSVTLCYYGLSFASTSLAGNAHSNYLLNVLIEIPGYIFCIIVMDCWGRRPILSFCQAISGFACVGAGLLYGSEDTGLQVLQVILSLIGKFGASACFAIVYVYTAELFPTIIRNRAIGCCSTVARVGGICSQLIILLKTFWAPLPLIVMGIVAIIAGGLAILFPETAGDRLPETMEDAINVGKHNKRKLTTCICPTSLSDHFDEKRKIRPMKCLKKSEEAKESNEGHVDYDAILEAISPFGRYQIQTSFLLWLATISSAIGVVSYSFTAFDQGSRCAIPHCESPETAPYFDSASSNFSAVVLSVYGNASEVKRSMVQCAIPTPSDLGRPPSAENVPETCDSYLSRISAGTTEGTCAWEDLIFDTTVVQSSITADFGFACENRFVSNFFNALYMTGMLIGSFIFGILSDKKGRMITLMISVFLLASAGTIAAFTRNVYAFGLLRVISGMGGMGCFMIPYVMVAENTAPHYIVPLGTLAAIGFPIGEMLFVGLAYIIRDWSTLQLVSHAPVFLGLLIYFVRPESTRWLLANGKIAQARADIRKVAAVNQKEVPENLMNHGTLHKSTNDEVSEEENRHPGLINLFKPRVIGLRSLNMFFQWYSVTMSYYGITFAITSLSGNPYLNFFLSALTELPGVVFGYYAINFFGRRFILSFLQSLAGVACIVAGLLVSYPSLSLLQTAMALIGKFGATCAFGTVYLYTSELFPTSIRGTAVGISSTIARVGGICALLLLGTKDIWAPLPMVIMGTVGTVAGCLALLLPETTGEDMPETLEDAINIGKSSKFKLCSCDN